MSDTRKYECRFFYQDEQYALTAEFEPVDVDRRPLKSIDPDKELGSGPHYRFSMTGSTFSSAGQIYENFQDTRNRDLFEIFCLWPRWHMNDLNAGTDRQRAFLKRLGEGPREANYDSLASANLETDRGYVYGSGWLYEELPDWLENRVKVLFQRLNFSVIDCSPSPAIEDIPVYTLEDLNRFLIAKLRSRHKTYSPFTSLPDDLGEAWDLEPGYVDRGIPACAFIDYAKDLAAEMGFEEDGWPGWHIDWEAAAEELKGDYALFEINGGAMYVNN